MFDAGDSWDSGGSWQLLLSDSLATGAFSSLKVAEIKGFWVFRTGIGQWLDVQPVLTCLLEAGSKVEAMRARTGYNCEWRAKQAGDIDRSADGAAGRAAAGGGGRVLCWEHAR